LTIKEIIFGGVTVAHVCEKCNGKGGGYRIEIKPDGTRDFVYGGWQNQDPQWDRCLHCNCGMVDTEEGKFLRKWLNGK
jgi:hypothetical protein